MLRYEALTTYLRKHSTASHQKLSSNNQVKHTPKESPQTLGSELVPSSINSYIANSIETREAAIPQAELPLRQRLAWKAAEGIAT